MTTTFSATAEGRYRNDYWAKVLQEALPAIDLLKGKIVVVKLGGSTLEHQENILRDSILLHMLGVFPVLVHGGGPSITAWLHKLHVPTRFENGLRVTDAQTLTIVRMVLLGQVNQNLVLLISRLGGKAMSLSGTDGNMIRVRPADERLGYVGTIESIDPAPMHMLIEHGYIPVIAPLGQGPDGTCLNINADLVAAGLAHALHAEKLIFMSDVAGIYATDGAVIANLPEREARQLIKDGCIRDGMLPKVAACLDVLHTVPYVHIVDGKESHVLVRELFMDQRVGTMMVRNDSSSPL